jgi:hypothetical protein
MWREAFAARDECRAPDFEARLLQFIEAGALSPERFQNILERHSLAGSWRKFEQQFLES